jgi:hypothetical protein
MEITIFDKYCRNYSSSRVDQSISATPIFNLPKICKNAESYDYNIDSRNLKQTKQSKKDLVNCPRMILAKCNLSDLSNEMR